MKHYDFETLKPRFGRGSGKWNELERAFPGSPEGIIPFSVADMEFMNAPEIREGLKNFIDHVPLGYGSPHEGYYEAVRGWMKRRHDWEIDKDWIVTSRGVVEGFTIAVRAFTGPGDGVILMTPVYYPMYSAIERNGRRLVENPLIIRDGHYRIDFEDLEKKAGDGAAKLLLLCSPHNPTGRVWTPEELERIGRICVEHGVLVVSDEIHCDLVMPGHTHRVFASISEAFARRSVIHTAPSKTFNLAGMQTSNTIISSPALREAFLREMYASTGHSQCGVLGYEACRLAYNECGEWLDGALARIHANYLMVRDFLSRELEGVRVFDLEGTYLLWLDFNPLGIDYRELERLLKEDARLFFDEGYIFGGAGRGFERWNLACPGRFIQKGLERLKGTLEKAGIKT
jgi:putative C-S lyase